MNAIVIIATGGVVGVVLAFLLTWFVKRRYPVFEPLRQPMSPDVVEASEADEACIGGMACPCGYSTFSNFTTTLPGTTVKVQCPSCGRVIDILPEERLA